MEGLSMDQGVCVDLGRAQSIFVIPPPPILSKPEKEEVLYVYLAVTNYTVSLVLVKNKNGVQRPVYYVNKSLHKTETCYLPLEKAVLAITHAMRKLPHYF